MWPRSGQPTIPTAGSLNVTWSPNPFPSDGIWIQASATPAAQRTPEQQQALALSDTLIEELMEADVIVLGVPMHNFSIPASLKAWFDLITRAGKTFSYGETGQVGLIPAEKTSTGDRLPRR